VSKQKNADILERAEDYALRIIGLFRELENDNLGRILGRQLVRCGTGIGANVEEAQGAQSMADFISKMSIAHKEAREAAYWIRLMGKAGIIPQSKAQDLSGETLQIIKILSSILLTSKQKAYSGRHVTRPQKGD